jgi:hypothetical protein
MKRERSIIVAAIAAAVALAGLLAWGFVAGRGEAAAEAEGEQTIKPAVQVTQSPSGPPTLTLSPALQREAHIELAQLRAAPYQQVVQAYGSVLELGSFTDVDNALASAGAQRAILEAKLAASRAAFERAQALYSNDRNFSRAQLQAAQATFKSDEASLNAARIRARNTAASADQAFGPVLGRSLAAHSELAQQLIGHRRVLIQVTLPPGNSLPDTHARASIQTPTGQRVPIEFVSAAIRTDPRIQGASFFYTAQANSGALPGMNVVALLPSGQPEAGVVIPASAVVWVQGRAWVYLRTGENAFARREIATAQPQAGGGYVVPAALGLGQSAPRATPSGPETAAQALPTNVPLVVDGAQVLLSQEFSAQINVEED